MDIKQPNRLIRDSNASLASQVHTVDRPGSTGNESHTNETTLCECLSLVMVKVDSHVCVHEKKGKEREREREILKIETTIVIVIK